MWSSCKVQKICVIIVILHTRYVFSFFQFNSIAFERSTESPLFEPFLIFIFEGNNPPGGWAFIPLIHHHNLSALSHSPLTPFINLVAVAAAAHLSCPQMVQVNQDEKEENREKDRKRERGREQRRGRKYRERERNGCAVWPRLTVSLDRTHSCNMRQVQMLSLVSLLFLKKRWKSQGKVQKKRGKISIYLYCSSFLNNIIQEQGLKK